MKKLFRNQVIQEHIIPTLIVVGWFSVLLVLAIMFTNA
jgi:hypothetical protein